MTATKEAKYDKFTITSADGKRTADFNNGDFKIITFDYFENILSPHITASATLTSTNDSVPSGISVHATSGLLLPTSFTVLTGSYAPKANSSLIG